MKRTVLSRLPNGDWRNHYEVQIFVKPEEGEALTQADRDRLANNVADALASVFTRKKLKIYLRGRWEGQEQAVCDLALLETVHGLFTPAYAL